MPDRRKHRGRHPEDDRLFGVDARERLRQASNDLSWLLGRGYASTAAVKLVGDRYRLAARQRTAVLRTAASDESCRSRAHRQCAANELYRQPVTIDGYNVLISLESALAGAVLLGSRDGCVRDLASLHGTYRTVEETRPAIVLAGDFLQTLQTGPVTWYLDAPISNSGRVAALIRTVARQHAWNWAAELVKDPDPLLANSTSIVATSDSWVLDHCGRWFNFIHEFLMRSMPTQEVIWLR